MSSVETPTIWLWREGLHCRVVEQQLKGRLAYVIRAAREARGMGPQELAKAVGVATSTIYSWESGSKTPSLLMLGPLCDALKVSPDLFSELPEEPPSPVEQYLRREASEGAQDGIARVRKQR